MFGLRARRPPLLGIDISSTAIKLIELAQAGRGEKPLYRVEAFASVPLPLNAVVDKRVADVGLVGQCIARAVRQAGSKAKLAAVAVSGSAVITKVISMSSELSDAELGAQIELEADQYVPYPMEEVNLDYHVLGSSSDATDMVDVLLAASRRENVQDRVAALEVAGLSAEVVDVEAYAIEGACHLLLSDLGEARRELVVAVIDVGATETRLYVISDDQVAYTREQSFGGNQLLDEIQRRYSLDREAALVRLDADDLPSGFDSDVRAPYTEALAQQISRSLQFFYSATSFNKVDQIILTGGSARLPHIDTVIADRLGFPSLVADPFVDMTFGSSVDTERLRHQAPATMVAVGLALRGFT